MHGLQTLQKLNDAAVAFRNTKKSTPVSDVVEGFFVFNPNGYEVIYHTADQLLDEPPFLSIEFKGEDSTGARFDLTFGGDAHARMKYSSAINRQLSDVVQIAAGLGIPGDDVAGRLGRLFVTINRN